MSGDQFHLLSRGARLGVVSSGVAALGGGLLWRVGRWVAGAGGVVLSGSARWCGIGQALRGRALLLRCDVSRKCSVGREGGREKKTVGHVLSVARCLALLLHAAGAMACYLWRARLAWGLASAVWERARSGSLLDPSASFCCFLL